MGLSGIGPGSLLLILMIVLLLFGTKRLRSLGSDLGEAIKNLRQGLQTGEEEKKSDTDQKPGANF